VSPQPNIKRINIITTGWTLASYPLYTVSLIQVLPENVEKKRWRSIISEPHTLTMMKWHKFQGYW
jgi:hypothetical protein